MNLKLLLSLPNCYNCKYFLPINKNYKRQTFNDLDKCNYFKYSINNNTLYHFLSLIDWYNIHIDIQKLEDCINTLQTLNQ